MAASMEVADLGEIVGRWAKEMFDITKNKDQSKIPKEALEQTINWKRVKFTHLDPEYADKQKPPKPSSQTLFKTFFTNNTDQTQDYSFKTDRTTSSTCQVEIERGFTIEEEMSLTLKSPCEIFEANAGIKREFSLTNVQGETFEEQLSWGVDSQIKVPPHTKTTAELVISEDEFEGNFVVRSKITGKVYVTFTNLKDNNSFVKTIEGDMAEIMRREVDNGLKGFKIDKKVVLFNTKGRCKFRFAIEQHVKISQQSLLENQEELVE